MNNELVLWRWFHYLWLSAAFFIPISIVPAQLSMYSLSVLTLWMGARGLLRGAFPRTMVLLGGFVCVSVIVSGFYSLDPSRSFGKMYRLFLFLPVWSGAIALKRTPELGLNLLFAFCAGVTVHTLTDLPRIYFEVRGGADLLDAGNMRDPQFYMCALLVLVCLAMRRKPIKIRWVYLIVPGLLISTAFLLHNKRGSWLAFMIALFLLILLWRRFKWLAAPVLFAGALMLIPQTRDRVLDIANRFNSSEGDRYALWTEIAPPLLRDHPFGIGYRAMRHDLLRSYSPNIQPRLNHLHNNWLQIAAETGWHTMIAWSCLVAIALARIFPRPKDDEPIAGPHARVVRSAVFISLVALILNGVVEYNWGDTELIMFYAMLLAYAFQPKGEFTRTAIVQTSA